jgi:methionyl-tRNA formyltransferase
MRFGVIEGFVLTGGGKFMEEFFKWLHDNYDAVVLTTPRYYKKGYFVWSGDINKSTRFLELGFENWMAIGFGEDYIYTQETIDAFKGRIINFMPIPHPRYRGGAHWTWAILNNETMWGCCMQLVTPEMKQGEFENGKVFMQEKFNIPLVRKPQHLMDFLGMKSIDYLKRFTQRVMDNDDFELEEIDDKRSEFYPRLDTEKDGKIDWNWRYEDVEKFIKAFDDPYKGAWTHLNGEKVHIKDCDALYKTAAHPFFTGRIFRIDDYIWVHGNGGILKIGYCSKPCKVGDRFN